MIKAQTKWLWVFLGMFVAPEILFSFLPSIVLFFFDITPPNLMERLVGEQLLTDNQALVFWGLIVEVLGVAGLLTWNVKFNKSKFRIIFSLLLLIVLVILLLLLYSAFIMRHGIGF